MKQQINLHNLQLSLSRYEEYSCISDLGPVIPFTHSETAVFSCPQKWYWHYFRGIRSASRSDALNYGTLWHLLLERLLKHFYMQASTVNKQVFLETAQEFLFEEMANEGVPLEQQMQYEETMLTLIVGWQQYWEENVMHLYEVMAVEMAVYYPTGVWLEVPCSTDGEKVELVHSSEVEDAVVNAQYVKVGKVDAVLRMKGTNELYILDHKTSGRAGYTGAKFKFDLQCENYGAMLQWMIDNGKAEQFSGHSVVGAFWDVASNKVKTECKVLKNGSLSQSKTGAPPSWVFAKAVKEMGLKSADYKSFIHYLKYNVDTNIFQLHEKEIASRLQRVLAENRGMAHRMSEVRKWLTLSEQPEHTELIAYRNTLQCMQWGSCGVANLCLQTHNTNGITNNEVEQYGYEVHQPFHWATKGASK